MNVPKLPDILVLQETTKVLSEIPYGVQMIGAPLEWPETKGKGIKVAVLDTGLPKHPDLKISKYTDFTGEGVEDKNGHSTHCCGIIAANGQIKGVAPEVELFVGKVLKSNGYGNYDYLVKALNWCVEEKVDIVSLSLSGSKPENDELHNTIKKAIDNGIIIVAASGNWGEVFPDEDTVGFPARYDEVIAVVAVDINKKNADFSSRGPKAELAAAGVNIWSTWLNGTYRELSGTSMACPHIAGACAILQAKALRRFGRKLTLPEIRVALNLYADDLGEPGRDRLYGFGVFSFGRFERSDGTFEVKFKVGSSKCIKNGQEMNLLIPPKIVSNRLMIGIRDLGNVFDAETNWDSKTNTVTVRK